MNLKTFSDLWGQFEELATDLRRIVGAESYEEAMSRFVDEVEKRGPAFSSVLRQLAHNVEPTLQRDDITGANFPAVLRMIDTTEKVKATLLSSPDELAPALGASVQKIRREVLPSIRTAMEVTAKLLPPKRGGGPKPLADEAHRQIYDEIVILRDRGFPLSTAFERVAKKHGRKRRTIERIWSQQKKLVRTQMEKDIISSE